MVALLTLTLTAQAQTVVYEDDVVTVEKGTVADFPTGPLGIFEVRPGKGVVGVIQPPGKLDFKQGNDMVVRITLADPSAVDGLTMAIEEGWLTVQLAGQEAPVVDTYLGTGWSFPPE